VFGWTIIHKSNGIGWTNIRESNVIGCIIIRESEDPKEHGNKQAYEPKYIWLPFKLYFVL
jgi:hypothetical protein